MVHMNPRIVRLFALALSAPLLFAACGGGGGSSAGASTTTTTSPAGRGARNSALTACLKQHGVTLPSGGSGAPGGSGPGASGPPAGGFGGGGGGPSISIPGVSQQQLQAAFSACRSKLPNGGNFGGGGANGQAFQAYFSCLRDHGVKVPTTTPGSSSSSRPGSALGSLRNDPKFAAANKTCQALQPTFGSTTTTQG